MTLKKFLGLLEGLLLDSNEIDTADFIEGVFIVETRDGARFQIEVTES